VLVLNSHGATWFQACEISYALIAPFFVAALAVYYWCGSTSWILNRVLGLRKV